MRFLKLERSLSLIWLLPLFATGRSLEDECASSFTQGLRISKALLGEGAGAVVLYAPAYERDPLKMRCTKELWRGLVSSSADGARQRPFLAVSLVPEGSGLLNASKDTDGWNTDRDLSSASSPSRDMVRYVVPTVGTLSEIMPGVARIVVAIDPWARDVFASPAATITALSRPLAAGGHLVLLHWTLGAANELLRLSDHGQWMAAVARDAMSSLHEVSEDLYQELGLGNNNSDSVGSGRSGSTTDRNSPVGP